MRRFADPICVLTGPDDQPQVFRWRGRRYEVTEVLAQWLEVTPWWRGPAAGPDPLLDQQRRVWRVAAGGNGGVFDLAAGPTRWLLVAALD